MRRKICVVTLFLVFIGQIVMAGGNTADFKYGKWHLKYTLSTGSAEYIYQGKTVFDKVGTGVSGTYTEYEIGQEEITDGFGTGMCFTVTRSGENLPSVIQRFFLYEGKDYFLTDVALSDEKGVETNYLRPISTEPDTRCDILGKGDNRVLIVPFDNDKWVRYRSSDLRGGVNSFEVSAVYNADTRRGIVIGSVEHDTWKSGVRIESDEPGIISRLELYTGASGEGTRDVLPHGKVKGKTVRSPKTFFGYFEDWRDGMEEFGRACATIAPPLPWNLGTPFGWNSWAKMEFRLSYEKVLEVSDFFKENLQNNNFENNGIVYIGMDAGWAKMSDEQLADIARHCKANGQKAGIYFTPFSDWGKDPEAYINGNSGYKCKDAYLYANGKTQNMVAGGLAMDPTHPAIKEGIRETAERFKRLGYEYIKIDFLTHGCAEADYYYDPEVQTGMQAYNKGMAYLLEQMEGMYITMAISPLFPSQYAHSRRIACDAWAGIGDTEYTLNSLTYGWWLNQVYTYNDPDHLLLEPVSDGENRARITSGVITGIFMNGDDLSYISGIQVAKDKARKFLTNEDINAIAKMGKSFRPVNGNMDGADFLFMHDTGKEVYLTAFNYSGYDLTYDLPLSRLGLRESSTYKAKELWSGKEVKFKKNVRVCIPKKDVLVFRITR